MEDATLALKNLFCDIETTGLKIEDGAVPLAIGFMLDTGPDDPSPEHIVVTIIPTQEQWEKANVKALEVNGFTWEKLILEGVSWPEAKLKICAWLADHDVNSKTVRYVGQNPQFDIRFMKHFLGTELGWMDFPMSAPVDVIDLAKQLGRQDRNVRFISFKGSDIALTMGVKPEGSLHTALGGIQAVARNYHALAKRMNLQ
jgi:hypothetical protein